jgi:dynein heavy chain
MGIFVTSNPAWQDRTDLPDNLLALFRPISMMVPDFELIAEIIFLSDGFQNAKMLSRKLIQFLKLSSE